MRNISYLTEKRETRKKLKAEYDEFIKKNKANLIKNDFSDNMLILIILSFFVSLVIWYLKL